MKKHKYRAVLIGSILIVGIIMIGVVSWQQMFNHTIHSEEMKENKDQVMEQEDVGENYRMLSESDQDIANLYAELYESSPETVATMQKDMEDWDKTAKELEKDFFTISENVKYQMNKEGYSFDDMAQAEKLAVQTGRKAMDLILEKGVEADHREWSDVVKDDEILSSEEQLGLSKTQIDELKKLSVEKEERIEIAISILNEQCSYKEVVSKLKKGLTIKEIKNQISATQSDSENLQ